MKILPTTILALFFSLSLPAQTLDEILNDHFQVMHTEEFVQVKSIILKGTTSTGGMDNPFTMTIVKPDYFRLDVPFKGKMMVQAYDKGKAWYIAPWVGIKPLDADKDQTKSIAKQADVDGPLYNWKEVGNDVKLEAKEDLNGTAVYKIKVSTKQGDVSFIYMDTKSFLILKVEETVVLQGKKTNSVIVYSDYKPIGSTKMLMAFSYETYYNGQPASEVSIDEIEIDPQVDMGIFQKPTSE